MCFYMGFNLGKPGDFDIVAFNTNEFIDLHNRIHSQSGNTIEIPRATRGLNVLLGEVSVSGPALVFDLEVEVTSDGRGIY